MADSGNVFAFASVKGGVGKTTLAVETACALANYFDKRVLLVDANFSAPNLALHLGIDDKLTLHHSLAGVPLHNAIYESHGVDVVPASLYPERTANVMGLKNVLDKFKARYDYIVIDSSPNYEELKPVVMASDQIFLVTSPDHVTLTTTLKAAHAARKGQTPVEGIIVNRIRNPRHEYSLKEIEEFSEIPVVAKLKEDKTLAESISRQKPMVLLHPFNGFSKEVRRFSSALCGLPEEEGFFSKIIPKSFFPRERVNREILRTKFYEPTL